MNSPSALARLLAGARRGRWKAVAVVVLTLALGAVGVVPASAFSFGESSDARPGIAYAGSTIYQAFAGTDSNNEVNIGALAFDSSGAYEGWASINTISGSSTYPGSGPSLAAATISGYPGNQIFAAWASSNGQLNIAHYTGTGSLSCWTTLPEYSWHSPYLVGVGGTLYLAWTGTDSSHHINVMTVSTADCPTVMNGQLTMLSDTASAGPAITTDGTNLYIAWPGTGSGENLWAGQYTPGSSTLAHHTCLCSYKSTDDIGLSINYGDGGELTYRGTDNSVYMMYVSLTSSGISSGGQIHDGSYSTDHGVDITDVPSGVSIPPGPYDSFTDAASGRPTVDPI